MNEVIFRQSTLDDFDAVMKIIDDARAVLLIHDNEQWTNSYPSETTVKFDIIRGFNYVLVRDGKVLATATLWLDEEPNYEKISNGTWSHEDLKYAVLHRVAVSFQFQGEHLFTTMLKNLFQVAKGKDINYIRVSTAKRNKKMISMLKHYGFRERGVLLENPNSLAFDYDI